MPSFAHPARYTLPRRSGDVLGGRGHAVAIGDVDGDGDADAAVVNPTEQGKRVSVFLNRDGTLGRRRDYRTGRGPNDVAIGDLNCDRAADLVVTDARAHGVSALLNRGNGTFRPRSDFRAGDTALSSTIADLDGDRDLAVANLDERPADGGQEPGTVSVLLNDGNGGFEDRTDYATSGYPESVSATDLNGDGSMDLAGGTSEGHLAFLLLNRGDGRFEPGRQYENRTGESWVATGDVTGDGAPDLALVANDQSDEVQESGGTLEPARIGTFANEGDASFAREHRFFVTGGYTEAVGPPVIADLNGDAKADVMVPRSDDEMGIVSLFPNNGSGGFRDGMRIDYLLGGNPNVDALAVADLNGDGRPDLVTANVVTSTLSVFLAKPGCTVQDVSGATQHVWGLTSSGLTLAAATRVLERANCRVGSVRSERSERGIPKGRVSGQRPSFGAVLPRGAKVNLVVSLGEKH